MVLKTFSSVKTWQWVSNDAYCPLDVCQEYGIPCNVEAQQKARDKQNAEFLNDYRTREAGRKTTAEEMYELRAAFGEGVEVVNVITGRKTKT